jgi:hypothetical protein
VVSGKYAQAESSSFPLTTDHWPLTTGGVPRRAAASRRGITLLEVLISMFVLLIGLMGVGAMIPAGRYEIMQGVKTDYGTTVGRAAFRDLKARGYLNPKNWADAVGSPVYFPATMRFAAAVGGPSNPVVAIDPLGVTATPTTFGPTFPFAPGAGPSLARINLFQALPSTTMSKSVADTIFRCTDDLITTPGAGRDAPPTQQPIPFGATGASILSRSSDGNYSWLATIVTDPNASALNTKVTVSVAVFYKRNLSSAGAGEVVATVNSMLGSGIGGGEMQLDMSGGAPALRPGQWIMLAGTLPGSPPSFRWYRVAGAAKVNGSSQDVTLAGADWNPALATTAFLFDGVIAVYEKNMQLEIE